MTPFEFPAPAGATDDQAYEIIQAVKTNELDAWETIANNSTSSTIACPRGILHSAQSKYTIKTDAIDKTQTTCGPTFPT